STSVFVNAHHSIGIRALLLFGTREQQAQWLPSLVAGGKLAAFALTEREAGSDAANVRMTATPSDDGSHYVLNGEKRYITNAAVSQVWTVMARTPIPNKPGKDAITAFLVTPDTAGVEMIEGRMPKLGIRGTATGRFRLNNVRVPKENILGPLGKGLRVALTVLDFGRTTFGACCTGGAKHCLQLAIEHANSRQQFKKTLGNFDLVKKKIARMAADVYAMEAMTNVTASLIDRGLWRAGGLPRTRPGHAVDSGADRWGSDGIVRLNLRAQPLGFGVTGARAKWRNTTIRFHCSEIFSAKIDSSRQGTVDGVER